MWDQILLSFFILFLLLFGFVIVFGRLLSYYNLASEFRYEDRPSLIMLYLKGFSASLFRKQGTLVQSPPLSDATDVDSLIAKAVRKVSTNQRYGKVNTKKFVCSNCRIDPEKLQQYTKTCGYSQNTALDFLPPCFLETYFLPLLICVTVSDDFKLSPLGLIHIQQTITQHCCIGHLLREAFDIECYVAGYRMTQRGVEVDMEMKVYDERKMCVWEGTATLLSRDKSMHKGRRDVNAKPEEPDEDGSGSQLTRIHIEADQGVQYARVSDDWNPHHLWPWSAKLLGFRQPIAHGMWTLARSMAWMKETCKLNVLPPFHINANFKRPIFMPSSSVFKLLPPRDKDTYWFTVEKEINGEPQLVGCLKKES